MPSLIMPTPPWHVVATLLFVASVLLAVWAHSPTLLTLSQTLSSKWWVRSSDRELRRSMDDALQRKSADTAGWARRAPDAPGESPAAAHAGALRCLPSPSFPGGVRCQRANIFMLHLPFKSICSLALEIAENS